MVLAIVWVGLVLVIRLVVQLESRPSWPAATYGVAFFCVLSLVEYSLLASLVSASVAGLLTFVLLTALTRLNGFAFWGVLVLGLGIPLLSLRIANSLDPRMDPSSEETT